VLVDALWLRWFLLRPVVLAEGTLEIAEPFSKRAADLGQFAGTEDHQRHDENHDQFGEA